MKILEKRFEHNLTPQMRITLTSFYISLAFNWTVSSLNFNVKINELKHIYLEKKNYKQIINNRG